MSPSTPMRKVQFSIRFPADPTNRFAARVAAEQWCIERGISVGRRQRDDPQGLLFGFFDIQKWRNLTKEDVEALHGRITTPSSDGDVVVFLHFIPEDFGVLSCNKPLTSAPEGAVLHDIAASLGSAHDQVANDFSRTNYSGENTITVPVKLLSDLMDNMSALLGAIGAQKVAP